MLLHLFCYICFIGVLNLKNENNFAVLDLKSLVAKMSKIQLADQKTEIATSHVLFMSNF